MICKHCGAEISDGAKFCSKCGARVEPDSLEDDLAKFVMEVENDNEDSAKTVEGEFHAEKSESKESLKGKNKAAGFWGRLDLFSKAAVIGSVVSIVLFIVGVAVRKPLPIVVSVFQIICLVIAVLLHGNVIKTRYRWVRYILLFLFFVLIYPNIAGYFGKSESKKTVTAEVNNTPNVESKSSSIVSSYENKSSSAVSGADENVESDVTVRDTREQKDGFDSTSEITKQGYTVTIPKYYTEDDSNITDDLYSAYAETGDNSAVLMMDFRYSDDKVSAEILNDEVSADTLANEYLAKYGEYNNYKVTFSQAVSNNSISGRLWAFRYEKDENNGTGDLFGFPSKDGSKWVFFSLTEANGTIYKYDSDFAKIIGSIKAVKKSDTDDSAKSLEGTDKSTSNKSKKDSKTKSKTKQDSEKKRTQKSNVLLPSESSKLGWILMKDSVILRGKNIIM